MPIAGLGLHFIIAIVCAIHAIRSQQPMYWLFILFAFPVLGSVVYIVTIYLPSSRLQRGARQAVNAAAKLIDPEREVREAKQAFDDAPTAQNQMRYAQALLEAGDAQQAAQRYEACLKGPFATDSEILFGVARAYVECQRAHDAMPYLEKLQREHPQYRPEAVGILLGRACAGVGDHAQAQRAFEAGIERFGTYQTMAEFTIWAYTQGNTALAARYADELRKIESRWNPMARQLNAAVARRLATARQRAGQ